MTEEVIGKGMGRKEPPSPFIAGHRGAKDAKGGAVSCGGKAAEALHFAYYNFVRIHRALRVTPAMEAGVTSRLGEIQDLLN